MATVVSSIEEQKKTIPQNTGNNVDESQALYGAGLPTVDTTPTTTTPEQTGQPLTIKEKSQQVSAQTGSYYTDVYLPKKQAEQQAKTGDISQIETPTPSKASAMTPEMIAVDYTRNNISATELENLKLTDPNKYNLAKAEIERSRTLEAINMTGSQYIEGQQKNLDSYLQKRNEIAGDDEGTKLREEVRAKYNIKGTQDSIAQYKGELEAIDSRMYKMTQEAGSGSAMGNRGEMIMEQRDLMEQRRVAVQGLNAQIDYLKLGLEQADAVVNDYKDYRDQRLEMMKTEFEVRTGMSKDEFNVMQADLIRELGDIDKYITKIETSVKEEVAYQRELEKEGREFERELFIEDVKFERDMHKAMTMAEIDFGYDVQLQKMSFGNQMALANFDAQTKLGLLRASKELDLMYPEYDIKEVEIDGVKTTVAVNPYDPTDYKAINTNLSKDYFSNIGSGKVTSWGGEHDGFQGVDIDGKIGDPVPTLGGKVVKVVTGKGKSSTPSYGNYVDIQDENGYIHRYAHLNDVNVVEGQTIPKGFELGTIGNSGYTISGSGGDGSHLDYSIKRADGNFMKSSEIPGYLSTLQKPEVVPQPVQELFGILQQVKEGQPGFSGAVGKGFWSKGFGSAIGKTIQGETEEGFVVGSKSASFAKKVEQIKNILAFDNLDKIKGAMSDKDIVFLKNINTSLSIDMTEEEFQKEVERVENTLLKKYSTTLPQVLSIPDFDNIEETKASSYLSIK